MKQKQLLLFTLVVHGKTDYKATWLPRLDSNQRTAGVKVLCLTTWRLGNILSVFPDCQTYTILTLRLPFHSLSTLSYGAGEIGWT